MRRTRPLSRRTVLAALGGLPALAGCAGDPDPPSGDGTVTATPTGTGAAPTGTGPPVLDVSSSVAGTSPPEVTVSVAVTGGPALAGATVSLAGGGRRDVALDGTPSPSFEATVGAAGGRRNGGLVRVETADGDRYAARFVTGWVPSPDAWDGGLTGAHYYPWYGPGRHWDASVETPVLGRYDSRDPAVVSQHVAWARTAGVDFLCASWWGPGTYEDATIRDYLFAGDALSGLGACILYEPKGRLEYDDGRADLDAATNRDRLRADFEYLAETYFDHEAYVTVDGRPVVYVYAVGAFDGDVAGVLAEVRSALERDPYVVADLVTWRTPRPSDRRLLSGFDAVTRYNPYEPLPDIEREFVERTTRWLPAWGLCANDLGLDFWPATVPGFDDSEVPGRDHPPLSRDVERYAELSRVVAGHADPDRPVGFVTSFNEWHENTQIEPADSYGESYLAATDEALTPGGRSRLERYVPVTLRYDRTVPEHEVNPDVPVDRSRDLAMALSGVELYGSDDGPERYGVRDVRSLAFTEGTYGVGSNENRTWRWTGGPTGRCRFYLDGRRLGTATGLRVEGLPVVDGLAAEVTVAGVPVAAFELGSRRWRTYDVGLAPTGEVPA